MTSRLWPILRKEFIHILRDPRALAVMILIPVVQLILLGYAATTDVRHLVTGVYDADHSEQSRALIEAYRASEYFSMDYLVGSERELAGLLDNGRVRAGLVVRSGYGNDLLKGRPAQVLVLIDGSDPAVANTVFAASQSVGQAHGAQVIQQRLGIDVASLGGVDVRPRVLYNPELRSSNYMIPGLIGLILQFLTVLFTAQSIVRERETGTIEQLVVTPIRPLELVVGKVLPYTLVAMIALIEILLFGVFWFQVPVRGSLLLLIGCSVLFLLTTLGQGILISTVARSQQEAILLTFLISLPGIFLAGFFFPLEAMPVPLQIVSYVVPLRYMLIIIRAIMLKGVGVEAFSEQLTALAILGPLLMFMAARRFRKSLE
ncbi:MAG: ABC transporter permease [Chloroflexi bacterium]|nr:ABC transporter permease [Chloroflexota bacterium]